MFRKIRFRVLTQYSEEAVKNVTRLLRKEGIKVYDLRETEIRMDSDESKVCDVYILCCEGWIREYQKYKRKHKYHEIIYEGFKTLQ